MKGILREHARLIYEAAINENMPNEAVRKALATANFHENGRIVLVSIGKAGWEMAKTAYEILGNEIDSGVVITKYGHVKMQNPKLGKERGEENIPSFVGYLGNIELHEAGHPVVDFNGICATKRALELTENLKAEDTVLLLISGGGSALFESVECPLEKMQALTSTLLKCGADINEINAIRKHISSVKGGRLAQHAYPAKVFAVVLSDVVGNDLSTIASGPACADTTTVDNCLEILHKYKIDVDSELLELIKRETPKKIENATHIVSGSVKELCQSAAEKAQELGYRVKIVNDSVTDNADSVAKEIEGLANDSCGAGDMLAFVFGGEVTVEVKGSGKGGRNQHLALMCAEKINDYENMAVLCVGSDGTDGPTDAAGGYVDADTYSEMLKKGISPEECLKNNDSYNGLKAVDGLIFTGPTGTNVNDLYMLLIK